MLFSEILIGILLCFVVLPLNLFYEAPSVVAGISVVVPKNEGYSVSLRF